MSISALSEQLFQLPKLDVNCGMTGCPDPAILRNPDGGEYLCATHALMHAQAHPANQEDIQMVADQCKWLAESDFECEQCERRAIRTCNSCGTPLCDEHYHLLPRNGAVCQGCRNELEAIAAAKERGE